MSNTRPHSLSELLDGILETAREQDTVSVRDLLDRFGTRSFGPLLAAPALIIISPVGAVPFLPAVLCTVVIVVCLNRIIGSDNPWLPRAVTRRAVPSDRLRAAIERVRPWFRRVDRVLSPRLRPLTRPPADRVLAALAVVLAASIYALGVVPFAAIPPATGIVLIGLAIMSRDGVAALLAVASAGASAWLVLDVLA
ncbi:MAG: exopolysaccharide biosynthesis protein [Phycisphaerales bacterium JB040]